MTKEYEAVTTALAMTEWFLRSAESEESIEKLERVAAYFDQRLKQLKKGKGRKHEAED